MVGNWDWVYGLEPFPGDGDGDGARLAGHRGEESAGAEFGPVGVEVELVVGVGIAVVETGVEGDGDCLIS